MSCPSCDGGCNCSGTMRSRRCSCQPNNVSSTRDRVNCSDNLMFADFGALPRNYESPYLMTTETYGSGLSNVALRELRMFDENVERLQKGYLPHQYHRRPNSHSRGIQPMTTLDAANAIRFGRDITIQ